MPDIKHFDPDATLETVVRLFWRQGVASTGIQDVVTATGLNRSSLYATFGGKQELYLAALHRYLEQRSQPMFRRLAEDERGLPAVSEFFDGLIDARCSGEYARWGCMVSNAHAGRREQRSGRARRPGPAPPGVARRVLCGTRHRRAPGAARPRRRPGASADVLALLAYGVNLRSRAGADAATLRRTVSAALDSIADRAAA